MRVLLLPLLTVSAAAQWQLQDSHSTASLRGIHAIGKGVAWASGSEGTVLRTVDQGKTWEHCAVPAGGEKLDFRGVQAFDASTAIVMSSGKGDLSRLYKTEDGCKTWRLAKVNPDAEGFWDGVQADTPEHAFILGDSVEDQLRIWEWREGWEERELELSYHARGKAEHGESSFAASNSVLQLVNTAQVDPKWKYFLRWSSGIPSAAYISLVRDEGGSCEPCMEEDLRKHVPMSTGSASGGVFSFFFRDDVIGVAVGGDYTRPSDRGRTAAMTNDGGQSWRESMSTPHGYRSAVAYDSTTKAWITVGPNGTDASIDDGRNWHPLTPAASGTADEDQGWNALSLPFVVGSKGRIGILRPDAIKP